VVERVPIHGDGREPLRLELESFVDAIRGDDAPVVSAREGRDALEIALRITREIEEGRHAAVEAPRAT
jgi:predicted dehydrogenase